MLDKSKGQKTSVAGIHPRGGRGADLWFKKQSGARPGITVDTREGAGLLSKTSMAATTYLCYKGLRCSTYTLKQITLAANVKNWLGDW